MRKIICLLAVFGLVLSTGALSIPITSASIDESEIISPLPTDTVHFVMTVKWGNVKGVPEERTESNFDGSIAVSSAAKVSLIRTLLFESHTSDADLVTSNMDPVSWNSIIYGHWDGVRVLVSSPADDNITISTAQGSITKTAKELYETHKPIVQDVGNGKEIVIKAYPAKRHAFIMKLIWGKTDRDEYEATRDCDKEEIIEIEESDDDDTEDIEENDDDNNDEIDVDVSSNTMSSLSISRLNRCRKYTKEDFSGSLTLSGGGKMKLVRTLRFEGNDQITAESDNQISWDSIIWGGVDGVLVKFVLDRNVTKDTSVTLTFDKQGYSKSISLLKLYHKKVIKNKVKPGYGVWASLWKFPNRKLIRAKNGYRVYVTEDGLKRHIPNPRVFADQGLDWDDVEEVEDDEVEVLPEGDPLSYTEGTLIRGEGPEVYAISNDEKRHIRNPAVFANLQYDWTNIIKVDDDELDIYLTGDSVDQDSDYPDSTLVKTDDESTVYVVEGDKLKPVTSLEAFDSRNYRWSRVKTISSDLRKKYKIGHNLKLGDGSLVKDPSGKIYRIDRGKKRWIRSDDDFNKAGFKWEKIVDVSIQEVNEIEEGEDVISDDMN